MQTAGTRHAVSRFGDIAKCSNAKQSTLHAEADGCQPKANGVTAVQVLKSNCSLYAALQRSCRTHATADGDGHSQEGPRRQRKMWRSCKWPAWGRSR